MLFPALSEDGWVDSPTKTADYLMSHFFVSDFSQTYSYPGKVSSFAKIIQANSGDPEQTSREVQRCLEAYFAHYFTDIICECASVDDPVNPSKVEIQIFLQFNDAQGVQYKLGRIIEVEDTIIKKIITVNNGA